jgi:phosphosulfolactate synthase
MNSSHTDIKAFGFIDILARSEKPRSCGLTMVLDKAVGLCGVEDLLPAAPYLDIIKLGWATPRLIPEQALRKKIALLREHGISVGNGGTLLEIAWQQRKTDLFFTYCRDIGLSHIEVSNGVIDIPDEAKAALIRQASEMGFFVMSEVGKKDPAADRLLSLKDRVREAKSDLAAGAHYVIIEAREGGRNLGIYDERGTLKEDMARYLAEEIGLENLMFEAPEKNQQAELILLFGPDVNLGNIRTEDIIPLETLRRGIRGDTCGRL